MSQLINKIKDNKLLLKILFKKNKAIGTTNHAHISKNANKPILFSFNQQTLLK
jgi:hypothetical protein